MIARTRKRPRVNSVNFATFWWLLRREAMVRVWMNVYGHERESEVRNAVLTAHPLKCLSCTNARLRFHPAEAYWP